MLLHGYREWGIDKLISRLRGMFAFGLWDSHTRRLYLVRDRLGVKPLVYTVRDGMIAFASTVSALRTAGYVGDLDENAVMDFLEFGFVMDERSIYRGAAKVPAASIVEWYMELLRAVNIGRLLFLTRRILPLSGGRQRDGASSSALGRESTPR